MFRERVPASLQPQTVQLQMPLYGQVFLVNFVGFSNEYFNLKQFCLHKHALAHDLFLTHGLCSNHTCCFCVSGESR